MNDGGLGCDGQYRLSHDYRGHAFFDLIFIQEDFNQFTF